MSSEIEWLKLTVEKAKNSLLRKYHAHSMGVGYKYVNGKRTSDIAIVFFVYRKRNLKELTKHNVKPVPETLFGYKTDVREIREGFKIRQDPKRYRPFQGGVSGISVKEKGATGTLGYINKGGEVLDNNHVLANESLTVNRTAEKGDHFIQPGYYDNGKVPDDVVGELDRWVDLKPIGVSTCSFGRGVASLLNVFAKLLKRKGRFTYAQEVPEDNYIDGAVGIAYKNLWKTGVHELGEAVGFKEPKLGMKVCKRGRTTLLTYGTVTAIGVSADVGGYQAIYTCHFADQVAIEADEGKFSDAGDSGSAILTPNEHYLVGLLFAGGTDSHGHDVTIASPAKYIKRMLNYNIP